MCKLFLVIKTHLSSRDAVAFFCLIAEMHQVFQKDLVKLQLEATRGYIKSLHSSLNPVSSSQAEPVKLSARVSLIILFMQLPCYYTCVTAGTGHRSIIQDDSRTAEYVIYKLIDQAIDRISI